MDTTAFASWLAIGLGRAITHLRDHDGRPYRDTILAACLHDTVYDRQCEGSRAPYLYDVIAATGESAYYRDHLLVASDPLALTGDDGEQIVALLGQFARRGDAAARAQLREIFAANATSDRPDGTSEIVEAEGIEGLLLIIASFPLDPDDGWYATLLVEDAAAISGEETVWAALRERAGGDGRIAAFLTAIEDSKKRQAEHQIRNRSKREPVPYAKIRDSILSGRVSPWSWQRTATDDDLLAAANDLLQEHDPQRLKGLLAIFARRAFPLDHSRLLTLAHDPNQQLADRARNALGNIAHADIRALGLALLAMGDGAGAALLAKNFQEGDFALIERSLASYHDRDEIHALGFGLRDIAETHPLQDATGTLLALYEVGPCALCRRAAVKLLREIGTAPDWLEREYEYDSYGRRLATEEE